ncbi:winged helix-turn-helix transcriptional regulator [Candidatus Woesearchaeota archaeon]|nr:winged helix-turn-helix transcriptional regulator [Candidatus Woesearchaeota archaeon]
MNNKKIGIIILVLSAAITGILYNFIFSLQQESRALGCFSDEECMRVESTLSASHIAFGVMGFFFGLGAYLLLFSRGEEAIVRRLENEQQAKDDEERFRLLLRGLDAYEQQIMKAVKEQDGITQNTLRLRTGLSKAKVSLLVAELERRKLIRRIRQQKTFAVHLAVKI